MTCTTVECEAPAVWRWHGHGPRGREWLGQSCDKHINHAVRVARQSGYTTGTIGAIA